MDWRQIPSLSGLRAFEATARLSSFSAAARELNVTHAAIAQHVRGLEDFFALQLVYRQGRKMELTAPGADLARALTQGFGTIEVGVRDLALANENRPLVVSTTPAFAENWLMPRLGAFWHDHPEIELSLRPTNSVVDLRQDGIDLAIRYGHGKWRGVQSTYLTSANLVVVGTEKMRPKGKTNSVVELCALPWLMESNRDEFRLWAEGEGLDFSKMQVTYFPSVSLVLSAARAGYGIAIMSDALVEADLKSQKLIKIYEGQGAGPGYYLVTQKDRRPRALETFVKWLKLCA